jgi:hypothetical protein
MRCFPARPEDLLQILAKPFQRRQALGGGLYDLGLRLKHFPSLNFGENPDSFADPPAWRAQDLQSVDSGYD